LVGIDSHSSQDARFCIGIKLKEFKIFSSDDDSYKPTTKTIDMAYKKIQTEKDKLTYKVIMIDGFSMFCDWEDIDNPEKGAFELEKVHEEEKLTTTA
jgi:hypothetical protein